MPSHLSKQDAAAGPVQRDPYEVLAAYRKMALKDKRRQYDSAGFEAVESESQELELDLSSLGAVNTIFAALFSKLGVPIKTSVSATVLEEALNCAVDIHPLLLGAPIFREVEKQCAHFYSVMITEEEARDGFVCQVQSSDKSKFKSVHTSRNGENIDPMFHRMRCHVLFYMVVHVSSHGGWKHDGGWLLFIPPFLYPIT